MHICYVTHSYVWHDSFICSTWLIHTCDMAQSYMWHDSSIFLLEETQLPALHMWHDSFICVTWLIRMCRMTHSYVSHDSFICMIWLIHMCGMTHSYAQHDSFILCIEEPQQATLHMWHDSFICATWLNHTLHRGAPTAHPFRNSPTRILLLHFPAQTRDMTRSWLICICDMTHSCVCHDSYTHSLRATWLIHVIYDAFICVIWLTHMYSPAWHDSKFADTNPPPSPLPCTNVWHDSFIYERWRIDEWDITSSYVRHDSLQSVLLEIRRHESSSSSSTQLCTCVTWLDLWMSHFSGIMSHKWMSHVSEVMSHKWMSRGI